MKEHDNFDKESWKVQKQNEKNKLLDLVNKSLSKMKIDSTILKRYLDVQAQFKDYSLYNALLILNQMPTATLLKDYTSWKKNNVFVKKYPNIVKILEPIMAYSPDQGKHVVGYNIKKMIDISDTDYKSDEQSISEGKLLESLLSSCSVPKKVVNELENNRVAKWDKDENILYISKGMKFPILFQEISKEITNIHLNDLNSNVNTDMKLFCTSYLLSKSNQVDISNYNFAKIEKKFEALDEKEIKEILDSSRKIMEIINTKISDYLYYKKIKEKNIER